MSLPDGLSEPDQQLVQYLLGLLPEADAERLDESSIADDEMAARLCGVEDDLVDAYIGGRLDRDTHDHFEAFYLRSPRRRSKVKFARRFLAVVNRAAVAGASAVSTPTTTVAASFDRVRNFSPRSDHHSAQAHARRWQFSWPVLTTAASMLLACGLFVRDIQLREGLNRAQRQSAAQGRQAEMLTKQLDEARTENGQVTEALEQARVQSESSNRPATTPSMAAIAASSGPTTSAILFPQTRSIGQPPTITIATRVEAVLLELRLESNEFPQYRAVLKNPADHAVVWRSTALAARPGRSGSVSVMVPASVLGSRHYSIELAGITAGGLETTISSYAFEIDRRLGKP